MKPTAYSVNGKILRPQDASILVSDLSILRGFGVFDFFRTQFNRPFMMEDHLLRIEVSAQGLGLDLPLSKEAIAGQVEELIHLNNFKETGIRIIVTGGYTEDSFTPQRPNLIIKPEAFHSPPANYYDDGVKLILHEFQREYPQFKTINYITAIMQRKRCAEEGALDTLLHFGGKILEVTRSNFFIIKGEILITPQANILLGITRKTILSLAKDFYKVEEREISLQELEEADEAFLTGSTKKIMPVVQVENHKIGNGKPGKITRRLMNLFSEVEKNYVLMG